jgi:hypothetical protein
MLAGTVGSIGKQFRLDPNAAMRDALCCRVGFF